jgi:hypothetical protein
LQAAKNDDCKTNLGDIRTTFGRNEEWDTSLQASRERNRSPKWFH